MLPSEQGRKGEGDEREREVIGRRGQREENRLMVEGDSVPDPFPRTSAQYILRVKELSPTSLNIASKRRKI